MKRQKRKTKRPNKRNQNQPPAANVVEESTTRRAFLRKARNGAIATVVVGSGSWFLISKVRAMMREQDLTRIGNGVPTVVQIHDPQCPKCIALQREARDAMCSFDDSELQYVVANIRSPEGRQLARAHGVGHVTLLLFDGAGQRKSVLTGPNESAYLGKVFRRHVGRSDNS